MARVNREFRSSADHQANCVLRNGRQLDDGIFIEAVMPNAQPVSGRREG
jgi:hypothetical protein